MDKVSWPAWYYGPNGASDKFDHEADVPAGWADHPSKVKGAEPSAKTPPVVQTPAQNTREDHPPKVEKSSGEVDAAGWPWTPELHAATKTKTSAGLWRMKVGVSRPGPKSVGQQGDGKPDQALDL